MSRIDPSLLPVNLLTKRKPVESAALIARLAVDKRYSGKDYGERLLIDTLN